MKRINPEHLQGIVEMINQGPYFILLNMVVKDLGPGYCRMECQLEKKHWNPFGTVHGGVYTSLIDTAAFWACYCEIEEDAGFTSLDVVTDMLGAAQNGQLVVEGRSIKVGRSICNAEAVIRDGKGRALAQGTSKMLITRGIQTISQAAASIGYKALPTKYIDGA